MPGPHLHLPPADPALSPRTGWSRAHWEAVADRLLDALVPYASPGFAQYRLPGRTSGGGAESDALEGFARSFLLAAFRIAGAGGAADPALAERYALGLAAGTDPDGAESWPRIGKEAAQPMVEAASIALALHETRPWIWDRLDTKVQERVADWLGGFVGARPHDNNWRLFQVVAEQFLASVGAPFAQADIDAGLDRIEDWYVGNGWYTDGDGRCYDYYGGWALHFYPLLWSRMAGPQDGGRTAVYRERLRQYLAGYPYFVGADGAPVHQGRSLTYRFAAAAPLWMGALADCSPLPPGLTRRAASGMLRHFVVRGVPDARGRLSLGWYRPFLPVTQSYSGPGSPYWAAKGFLGLLLPAEHPVWTAAEEPLPVEESDFTLAVPEPGWLLHGTRSDGLVRMLNHGTDHMPYDESAHWPEDPHYVKLAYSTATAPETSPEQWRHNVDNHLAILGPDGTASRRARIHPLGVAAPAGSPAAASSWHEARLPGDEAPTSPSRVRTTSVVHGPWEVRVHRVDDAPAGCTVREGGYAVAAATAPEVHTGPGWVRVRRQDGLSSTVVGLHGWDEDATAARAHDANAFGPHSATPCLRLRDHPGGSSLHVTLVALTRDPVPAAELRRAVQVRRLPDGTVAVRLPDGTELRA